MTKEVKFYKGLPAQTIAIMVKDIVERVKAGYEVEAPHIQYGGIGFTTISITYSKDGCDDCTTCEKVPESTAETILRQVDTNTSPNEENASNEDTEPPITTDKQKGKGRNKK